MKVEIWALIFLSLKVRRQFLLVSYPSEQSQNYLLYSKYRMDIYDEGIHMPKTQSINYLVVKLHSNLNDTLDLHGR